MPEYLTLFTKELFGYIENYGIIAALAGLCAGVLYLALVAVRARFAESRTEACSAPGRLGRAILVALFCAYLTMLLAITVLSRKPGSITMVNLKPFDTFRYKRFSMENVMLFLPFGFFYGLAAYGRRRWYAHWYVGGLAGTLASVCIETVQYLTARGGVELDDVLTNTTGMLCGYAAAALVRFAWQEE